MITAKVFLASKVDFPGGDGQKLLTFSPDYNDGRNKEWAKYTPGLSLRRSSNRRRNTPSPSPRARTEMDFGAALDGLRRGLRVARAGWNGKGMWIALERENLAANRPFGRYDVRAYIEMKTVDDDLVPWVASQTDLLAEDWEVV